MKFIKMLCSLFLVGCTGASSGIEMSQVKEEVQQNQAFLIDVRELDEVAYGYVQDAIWLPMSQLMGNPHQVLAPLKDALKDKKVYVYCRSGARSGRAASMMKEMGLNVENIGGFSGLKSHEFPVVKGKPTCCS